MADNVQITAGSGTTISTDDAGASGHIQRMKLCYGADGDATQVGADANGLDVDVTRLPALPAGTNNIGDVDVLTLPNVTVGAGDVDNDAANTAKVVQVGGHASPNITRPTAVSAAGDRVRQWLDLNGAMISSPRKLPTYGAEIRAAARPYRLTNVFGAAGRKQWATIHHLSSATKTVRIRRAQFRLESNTAAVLIVVEFIRITAATTPATGNPAVTPVSASTATADVTAEATVLVQPTTTGTETGLPFGSAVYTVGITGGSPTLVPPVPIPAADLFTPPLDDDETKMPEIRAGTQEGWAITVDVNAATTVGGTAWIEFTEE